MTQRDTAFTRHIAQLEFAKQFRDAANALHQTKPRETSRLLSFHFLIGHTIELALKSTLVLDGASDEDLRSIGHDLDRALSAFRKTDLSRFEHVKLEGVVALLNPYYKRKELEYFVRAQGMRLPLPSDALEGVDALLRDLDGHYRALSRNAS